MKIAIPVFMGALLGTGCTASGGDMIIRVSGSVPESVLADKSGDACQLGMVSAETGEQLPTRGIPAEFSTTMMVVAGPKPNSYYFVAECDDRRKFRSDEVIISSRSSHSRTFDLGALVEILP